MSLPPTSNTLTSHQRKQLQRTTAKIGHILGTTPQVHLDDGFCLPEPSSSHVDSPLLRLTPPPSDLSPDSRVTEQRLAKMDRLRRTLGDDVPPELVFGHRRAKSTRPSKPDPVRPPWMPLMPLDDHSPARAQHDPAAAPLLKKSSHRRRADGVTSKQLDVDFMSSSMGLKW